MIGMDYRKLIETVHAMPHRELVALAEKAGIGLQTLREIKYGRCGRPITPTLVTLEKLRKHVKVSAKKSVEHAV